MVGLKDVIQSSAPIMASLLSGSYAGIVLNFLAHAFGVSDNDVSKIYSVIANNPEAQIKLKALENEHAEMLAKLYQMEVDDRKDARKNSVPYKDFVRHMAYVVTVGFFVALLLLFLPIEINSNARELLSMLVGMLASKWQTIIDFFYGSSRMQKQQVKL